jgi:hypothetical protein
MTRMDGFSAPAGPAISVSRRTRPLHIGSIVIQIDRQLAFIWFDEALKENIAPFGDCLRIRLDIDRLDVNITIFLEIQDFARTSLWADAAVGKALLIDPIRRQEKTPC